jgi:hypothetical protein
VAEFLAPGVGPGGELGSIASDMELVEVDKVQVRGAGNEAGEEDAM